MPWRVDMRRRMDAHASDRVVSPAHEFFRKESKREPQRPRQPPRLAMSMMLDLHAHEEWVVTIVGDLLGEVDDARRSNVSHHLLLVPKRRGGFHPVSDKGWPRGPSHRYLLQTAKQFMADRDRVPNPTASHSPIARRNNHSNMCCGRNRLAGTRMRWRSIPMA